MKFKCVPGEARANTVEVTGVPQRAFDLAMATEENDHECVLFRLLMSRPDESCGGMMTLETAEDLANGILEIIADVRKGKHAFEGAA